MTYLKRFQNVTLFFLFRGEIIPMSEKCFKSVLQKTFSGKLIEDVFEIYTDIGHLNILKAFRIYIS